ncbi:NAD(P)-dependent oxidoreductase [Streptomyces filamentosus]|uniref:NAD(P)-dependent oxidoreductase n=1 Tax=Streptomyces filamentosus TaxID=67294 RepID=UPI0038078150
MVFPWAQAAERGHSVRALVCDPSAVHAPADIELIQGTPANIDDIRKAAHGTRAVISVLNNARAPDNPWAKPVSPPMFMTDAARNTLTVMAEQGIRRIALASTQGAGGDWARLNPLMKAFVNLSNIKAGFTDHTGVDQAVRASDTGWTLACAVALTGNPATGPLRVADPGTTTPGRRINRADLARFLLDAVDKETWIRRAPLVWNGRSCPAARGRRLGRCRHKAEDRARPITVAIPAGLGRGSPPAALPSPGNPRSCWTASRPCPIHVGSRGAATPSPRATPTARHPTATRP